MSQTINYEAEQFIQSQSPKEPFIAMYESDESTASFYAVLPSDSQPNICDQIVFSDDFKPNDLVIQWNEAGTRCALIADERIVSVFDFIESIAYALDLTTPVVDTKWTHQQLEFSNDLAVEFGMDQFFKQIHLDNIIAEIKKDDNQINRLKLYKELLKSKLFVPITAKSPDDPNALIYTFPNNLVEDIDIDNPGNLVCTFTNVQQFTDQIGQFGIGVQKIAADFLCYQAHQFDNILGITITASDLSSVLITRDEFKMLSLISKPQRMDSDTLLKELGDIFFDDITDTSRLKVSEFYIDYILPNPIVKSGFYCRPSIGRSKPFFCVIVNSIQSSNDLNSLVLKIKSSELQSMCDCHVFSLSDTVAKSLDLSKKPL
jgi:hypothetical protein